jgi:hypothetical protein
MAWGIAIRFAMTRATVASEPLANPEGVEADSQSAAD